MWRRNFIRIFRSRVNRKMRNFLERAMKDTPTAKGKSKIHINALFWKISESDNTDLDILLFIFCLWPIWIPYIWTMSYGKTTTCNDGGQRFRLKSKRSLLSLLSNKMFKKSLKRHYLIKLNFMSKSITKLHIFACILNLYV